MATRRRNPSNDVLATPDRYYANPRYYDAVSNYRNFVAECDFARSMFTELARRPLKSVLEIACGPAYHGRQFASEGCLVTGFDYSDAMVAYVQELAKRDRLPLAVERGDMRTWKAQSPADLALITQFSFGYLLTNDEILQHLRNIADGLKKDGVYIIDLRHPRKVLTNRDGPPQEGNSNGLAIRVRWGGSTRTRTIDVVRQIIAIQVDVTVFQESDSSVVEQFSFLSRERFLFPEELRAIVDLSGCFRLVKCFGDFSVGQPIEKARGRRLIAVLQKRP